MDEKQYESDFDETIADVLSDDADKTVADALSGDFDETLADDDPDETIADEDSDETLADEDADETIADDDADEEFAAHSLSGAGDPRTRPSRPRRDLPAKHAAHAPEIPDFTYVGRLGGGGFADVYRYRDQLGRDVAVKVLRKGMSESAFSKFEQEASLMALLSGHPNIVTIYQFGMSEDGRPFLVMEMYPGGSLSTEVKEQPYSYEQALRVGIQIAGAIETAHQMGVLHRDIKPSNILFNRLGHPALTDFGISVSLESEAGARGGMSPQWAPPEQFPESLSEAPVGAWSDVYAFAATLWAAMEGHSPMWVMGEANDYDHLRERAEKKAVPDFQRAKVPADFVKVLRIAMSKDPRDRYQSVLDFARAMQKVQAAHDLPITPVEVLSKDGEIKGSDSGLSKFAQAQAKSNASRAARPEAPVRMVPPAPAPSFPQLSGSGAPSAFTGAFHGAGVQYSGAAYGAAAAAATPAKKRPVALIVAIVVAAVVLICALIALLALRGGGSQTTGTVPQVTSLVGVVQGDTVQFTWGNPDQLEGDSYHYAIQGASGGDNAGDVTEPLVTVQKGEGQTCIEVQLVRSDGSKSAPKSACAK